MFAASTRKVRSAVGVAFTVLLLAAFVLILPPAVSASGENPTDAEILAQVGFDQNLDAQMPLDAPLIDEQGRSVTLAQYVGKKPAVLVFTYYSCPNLCPIILHGLTESLRTMQVDVGDEYDIIVVSIDPRETPENSTGAKAAILASYGRWGTERSWHFLTGPEPSIAKLAATAGFRYAYDPKSDEYAHPSGILVLTPTGHISKYLYGLEFSPRDLRLALVDASQGKIGTFVDQLLLTCFNYDPTRGKYSLAIKDLLKYSAVLMMVGLGAMIIVLNRKNRTVAKEEDTES